MIRIKSGIVLTYLFLFLGSDLIAQDPSRANDLLSEADVHIGNNQLGQALEKTREALRVDPSSMAAIQKQINIYYLMNDNKEALRLADAAIKKYPGDPELLYLRGIINNSRGRYARALEDFDQALTLQDEAGAYKIYLGRGIAHMSLVEYEQAMSDFSRSIELNDNIAGAYHSRALLNYELQDYHAAIEDFLKTLERNVENDVLYFNLGMSYYRLSDRTNACPYFHKACTMGNNNACRMVLMECAKALPYIP
ncbi:MAG: tetratricopeptide repeat protein [Bacteroidales bacterium]|nr:tetratricopeptide repeat protein [Bacteroidales bacterium]